MTRSYSLADRAARLMSALLDLNWDRAKSFSGDCVERVWHLDGSDSYEARVCVRRANNTYEPAWGPPQAARAVAYHKAHEACPRAEHSYMCDAMLHRECTDGRHAACGSLYDAALTAELEWQIAELRAIVIGELDA